MKWDEKSILISYERYMYMYKPMEEAGFLTKAQIEESLIWYKSEQKKMLLLKTEIADKIKQLPPLIRWYLKVKRIKSFES